MLEEQTETSTTTEAAEESPTTPPSEPGGDTAPARKSTSRARKATAKKTASSADTGGAGETPAETPAEAPAKKATAKRTTKKAAAGTTAKKSTRTTKKAAGDTPQASGAQTPSTADGSPVQEESSGEGTSASGGSTGAAAQPLFQAPDTATAKRTAAKRSTRKTASTRVDDGAADEPEQSGQPGGEDAPGSGEPGKPATKTAAKKTAKKTAAKKSTSKKAASKKAGSGEAGSDKAGSDEAGSDEAGSGSAGGGQAERDAGGTVPGAPGAGDASDIDTDTGDQAESSDSSDSSDPDGEGAPRRRRRRGGRRRRKGGGSGGGSGNGSGNESDSEGDAPGGEDQQKSQDEKSGGDSGEKDGQNGDATDGDSSSSRRRRRRRRAGEGGDDAGDDPENTVTRVRKARSAEDEITSFSGSTRLEAKKQRRREGREAGRRRAPIISEAEFLARREAVDRAMVIRQRGDLTQIAVLEDKVLVEHYVARESQTSLIGNVYLGRVQNVLPSMEAAFIDIGKGRNAVLYAGEVNWEALGAKDGGQRKIEQVLKPGQAVLVQVTKDPIGHKGARLTSQISLPGRFLVYVPGGTTSGISRKLPEGERNRLKNLLKEIVPDTAGVIVRTAAEGASEEELTRDVQRLTARWEDIEGKVAQGKAPELLYGEPDLTLKVVRDLFTEDFAKLVVSGDDAWDMVESYVQHVAPDLADRLERHDDSDGDAFSDHRIDEQIAKALERKVWLPSGGSLVIDRTEAMTVVDVNTGKFTGSGGNLEETVTKNNLEAAEEIVRQLRLRDIGGIIVVDFIDMVLESNRDLVLRRLVECLGRDRTRHQVAEVTSLGLVQMTRKRIGTGLLEAFSESCDACQGRGLVVHNEPVEPKRRQNDDDSRKGGRRSRGRGKGDSGQDQGSGRREDSASGGSSRSGKDTAKDSAKDSDSGSGSGKAAPDTPRRPTPAEFAAMAGAEKHDHDGDTPPATPAGADEAAPGAATAEAASGSDSAAASGASVSGPQVSQPQDAATQDTANTDTATPDDGPQAVSSEDGAEALGSGDAAATSAPSAPPAPAAPRIVTSTRRIGARRAAGPPSAPTAESDAATPRTEDAPGGAEPQASEVVPDEGGDGAPDESPDGAAVHVPVKKKGTRRR